MNELYSLHVNMIDYFQKHKNRIAEEYLQCDIMYMKSENLQNDVVLKHVCIYGKTMKT